MLRQSGLSLLPTKDAKEKRGVTFITPRIPLSKISYRANDR
jgi:hypothetical protein